MNGVCGLGFYVHMVNDFVGLIDEKCLRMQRNLISTRNIMVRKEH
jgi:hypothetical protein